ncbi:MAG: hypothetical protein PVH61_31990 [Candidatus Aminicenantes bacterium]
MIKKTIKVIMILIMLLGITLSILNFISIENQAKVKPATVTDEGTIIVMPDGRLACQGAPLNC